MSRRKTITTPAGEALKRVGELVFSIVRHGESADDPDARDPRRLLPNGTRALRGPAVQIRDLDDWPRR